MEVAVLLKQYCKEELAKNLTMYETGELLLLNVTQQASESWGDMHFKRTKLVSTNMSFPADFN